MSAKKYDPADEHDPLFDITQIRDGGGLAPVVKTPRATSSELCPECTRDAKVGLVREGACLVWRAHTYTTWGGTVMPCRASGVPLCQTGTRGRPTNPRSDCFHD